MPEAPYAKGLLGWTGLGTPHAFENRGGHLTDLLPGPLVRLRQVHGNSVHVIDRDTALDAYHAEDIALRPAGDALITAVPGLTVSVATADCVPVLLHDPVGGVVAAVHAGWRGLAAEVIAATVRAMTARFDCRAADCRAAIGPCVGATAYRVGRDVTDAFAAIGLPDDLFRARRQDAGGATWLCDLERAAATQLRALGLDRESIWVAHRCTVSEPASFHSFRRDGAAAGRMAAGIALG